MNELPPHLTDPRTAEILAILAKETGLEAAQLRPEATIEELGIASLDLTQAVFEIETRFGVEIPVVADRPAGTGAEFTAVGDLVAHVMATLDRAGKHGAA
jgi:acyl carrier protein